MDNKNPRITTDNERETQEPVNTTPATPAADSTTAETTIIIDAPEPAPQAPAVSGPVNTEASVQGTPETTGNPAPDYTQPLGMIPPRPLEPLAEEPSHGEPPRKRGLGDTRTVTWVLVVLSMVLVFVITPFISNSDYVLPALIISVATLIIGVTGTALAARNKMIPATIVGSVASTLAVLSIIVSGIAIGANMNTGRITTQPSYPYYSGVCAYDDYSRQTLSSNTTSSTNNNYDDVIALLPEYC